MSRDDSGRIRDITYFQCPAPGDRVPFAEITQLTSPAWSDSFLLPKALAVLGAFHFASSDLA